MPGKNRTATGISKTEGDDLCRIIRKRAKAAKDDTIARAAELKSEFEKQLDRKYSFDESPVWAAAVEAVQRAVREGDLAVQAECARLGIPEQFRPRLTPSYWVNRGENIVKDRRIELRRIAHAEIDALMKRAQAEIEKKAGEAETVVIVDRLSDGARTFLASLPKSAEMLMPMLDIEHIGRLLDQTPLDAAERQRRRLLEIYREDQP